MSVAISIAIGSMYAMHTFGYLGSPHNKYCLANEIDYHPYPYTD